MELGGIEGGMDVNYLHSGSRQLEDWPQCGVLYYRWYIRYIRALQHVYLHCLGCAVHVLVPG